MQTPDNFAYIVLVDEHDLLHTDDHPFCFDQTCDYHEDGAAIAAVYQAVQDGIITPEEAMDFVHGRLL